MKNTRETASGGDEAAAVPVLNLVQKALEIDLPLYDVLAAVEKAVLTNALRRHASYAEICAALRIPRTSFYAKRKRFFAPD